MNVPFKEECFWTFFQEFFFHREARKFTDTRQLSLKALQLHLLISVLRVSVEVLHVTVKEWIKH